MLPLGEECWTLEARDKSLHPMDRIIHARLLSNALSQGVALMWRVIGGARDLNPTRRQGGRLR